ncbi:MAG: GT-D fold domain-containing protein [Paludibacter sp.]
MNPLFIFTLMAFRKLYAKAFQIKSPSRPNCEQDQDKVSQIIYEKLLDDKPCMIARFGAFELNTVVNYLGVTQKEHRIWKYIKGDSLSWWWDNNLLSYMRSNAGFFPPTQKKIIQFCELMLEDMKVVDVLGSWQPNEIHFEKELAKVQKVRFILLDPFWAKTPWTKALEGKKVLVVHPFANTIVRQYKKREILFKNNLLPQFKLITINAVQSIAGAKTPFKDWFEALEFMKAEIDKQDYDICLIGAGAYGFPLAAHVKRNGKKGFQLGGSLQLLFGIHGKRWNKNYSQDYDYSILENEHWVKPGNEEKPEGAEKVEGACYW